MTLCYNLWGTLFLPTSLEFPVGRIGDLASRLATSVDVTSGLMNIFLFLVLRRGRRI